MDTGLGQNGACCERAESTRHHMTHMTLKMYLHSCVPILHCFEALIAKVIPKHM
jgi:hypothetical protein